MRDGRPHRLAVNWGEWSRESLEESLESASIAPGRPPRVGFLFTGQGAQSPGMGRALYESAPVFRDAIDRLAVAVPDLGLVALLCDDNADIHHTANAQPALFALEVGLAANAAFEDPGTPDDQFRVALRVEARGHPESFG